MHKFIGVFMLLLSHLCNANTLNLIEIDGYRTDIRLKNYLSLTQTESPKVWQHVDNDIKFHFIERLQSIEDLKQSLLKTLNSDADSILTDNPVKEVPGAKIFTTRSVKNGSSVIRVVAAGGNDVTAFMVIFSIPEIHLNSVSGALNEMINSLTYSATSLSLFHDMPFEISNISGFYIQQKYQNSLILKSTPYNSSLDALMIFSALPEPEAPPLSLLKEKTIQLLQRAENLSDIKIIEIVERNHAKNPQVLVKAKAILTSNDTPVDILHTGSLIDTNYLISQLIVEKASVSLLKMDDILSEALLKIRFN